MDWLMNHWVEIGKLIGEVTAAVAALTTAIIGLCSIIVNKIIPVLETGHPALPLVKLLGKVSTLNETPVVDEDRPVQPPTTPADPTAGIKAAMLIICLSLLTFPAFAQTQTVNAAGTGIETSPAVSVTSIINAMSPREGIMIDFIGKRGLNYAAVPVYTFMKNKSGTPVLVWDAGLLAVDGLGTSLDYNLGALKPDDMPILNFLNYGWIGAGGGVKTITVWGQDNPASDNRPAAGVTLSFSFKG